MNGLIHKFSSMGRLAKIELIIALVALGALGYLIFVYGHSTEAASSAKAAQAISLTSEQASDMSDAAQKVGDLIPAAGGDAPTDADAGTWYEREFALLYDKWSPLYEAAISDLLKFENRFYTAEDWLETYKSEQRELTNSVVNDRDLRRTLMERDKAEFAAYDRWISDGDRLVAEVRIIHDELVNMNTVLEKQQLTITMLKESEVWRSIPDSALKLHASLDGFREQSNSLTEKLHAREFSR